ncbi:MAG: outer membrane receptor for ferrienterochelin and colicin [Candidatus Azotimanducaceae bacterium]|jgi:outer membrane receptor for ferrienterochelin and colicin
MQYWFPCKRRLLRTAISLSLLPISSSSFAQDAIEEVVVTGSFIRRSKGFTQASSLLPLTAVDLEAQGTMNMGEVIQNLAFVNGAASSTTNSIQGTNSLEPNIDLRGLGASSTLTLMDSKRVANENVMGLLPQIAIQRLDIVADGAALSREI